MDDPESLRARLDNVHAIEPILSALRTSSLGRWQAALKKLSALQSYGERLETTMSVLLPLLPTIDLRQIVRNSENQNKTQSTIIVLYGSEGRLCGDFNTKLISWIDENLSRYQNEATEPELLVVGKPLSRLIENQKSIISTVRVQMVEKFSTGAVATDYVRSWMSRYVEDEVGAVLGVYNQYLDAGRMKTICEPLIPPLSLEEIPTTSPWPSPIIETNPLSLFARVVEQLILLRIATMLTQSSAAENAARYQLMESAMDNVERLTDDLEIEVHAAARRAITREMQTLISASGLHR